MLRNLEYHLASDKLLEARVRKRKQDTFFSILDSNIILSYLDHIVDILYLEAIQSLL